LRDLVRRYSDFIAYPIYLEEVDKKEEAKQPDDDKPLNTMVALWKRAKSDVKTEEYEAFYRQSLHGAGEPMRSLHIVAEGMVEYRALIFIPKHAGMEMMIPGKKHGLSLYVRNVFIGDEIEELVPSWMRFIKGVVDSSDLPLNVSREMLQDDAIIRKIRNDITNRVLKALAEMAKEKPEDYDVFTTALGDFVKEGYHSDWEHREKLQELLRFRNLKDGAYTSLKAYKDAMPEGQKAIDMLPADSMQAAKNSPCLEALKAKNYDVLFLTTPVDQFIASEFYEYDKTPIIFADKGDLKLDDDEAAAKEKQDAIAKEYKDLTDCVAKQLDAYVREVRVSTRLTDSPCCLVQDPQALNPAMRRMMEAMGQSVPEEKRILEINPTHPCIQRLSTTTDEAKRADTIDLLYAQACLAEGSLPPDPTRFNQLVTALMQ
jgi:molecular chaperone HtpG